MDDELREVIDKKVYDNFIGRLGDDYLRNFPFDPDKIYKHIVRRRNPKFSSSINKELAQKMIDERLSDEQYLETVFNAIAYTFNNKRTSADPKAVILLAQTGAGKTRLRIKSLKEDENLLIINSDLYKKFNPKAENLRIADPTHFGALTGIDSYDNAENITHIAMDNGYSYLLESAPSMSQGMIGVDKKALNQYGYKARFDVMAVGNLVSAYGIHHRYEEEQNALNQGIKTNSDVKLTDLKRHDDSYSAVEECINDIPNSDIYIYRRGKKSDNTYLEPVLITDQEKTPLEILKNERYNSNIEFIETGACRKDTEFIEKSMYHRRAPSQQIMQFEAVKEKVRQFKMNENISKTIEGRDRN